MQREPVFEIIGLINVNDLIDQIHSVLVDVIKSSLERRTYVAPALAVAMPGQLNTMAPLSEFPFPEKYFQCFYAIFDHETLTTEFVCVKEASISQLR